jgi:hypothetical protein
MRIYIPILLFTLFIVSSCDKEEITSRQMETFVKFYGGSQQDEGYKVISLNDGGYLLMGNMETPSKGKDICLIRTDKFGNSIAPVHLYGFNYDDIGYAIKKNSYGYVIAGSTVTSGSIDKKSILLIQTDEEGKELWKDTIGSPISNEEAFDFVVYDNNKIALTGYSDFPNGSNKDMIFVRTDSSFKKIGKIDQLELDNDGEGIIITESDKEEEFIIVGYTTKILGVSDISIIKLKGTGIPTAYYLNNYLKQKISAKPVSFIPAGNESYILAGNLYSTEQNPDSIKVMKISFNKYSLNIVWNKTYGEKKMNQISCSQIMNDKIYILATAGASDKVADLLILELDSEGNNPMYHYIGDGTSSFKGRGFDFATNGIVITGANNQNSFSMIMLIKINDKYSL